MSSHYFDASPAPGTDRRTVSLVLPDLRAEFVTDRGVFSRERVDTGTKLLLLDAPRPPGEVRHALDLGCGYGPIAVTMATRWPAATVYAVDVNERAVALCQENAAALGCDNVKASLVSDEYPYGAVPADVRFDLIWSNPPIRVGKPVLHPLLRRWLARLAPAGRGVLVVQKHLGSDSLQRWLFDEGYGVERLTSRAGYRLLVVAPAPTGDDG